MTLKDILEYKLIDLEHFDLTVYSLLFIGFIWVLAWGIVFGFHHVLNRAAKKRKMLDKGTSYTILKLIRYFIYVIAAIWTIDALGFDITVLIFGSTALFVGLGLGLQNYFHDLTAGMTILFEGSIKVDDIVNYEDRWGIVEKINLRTTLIRNWDGNIVVIPNAKLVDNEIMNLSHTNKVTRFELDVFVHYGSDIDKVKEILLSAAKKHDGVYQHEPAFVRFKDFGENGLHFQLMFFTILDRDLETVKSDLRFDIEANFRKEGVVIPYPQRDVHIKGGDTQVLRS